jgi:hypothetical protein
MVFTIFGFVLGSLLTLAVGIGLYFALAGYFRPAPANAHEPVFTRPEFSRRVMGKSETEVVEAVGKPDETSEDAHSRYWHFKGRTRDPLTQEKDSDVQLVFKSGKVANVNY